MKALFVTTGSTEVANHVQAWDSLGEKSARIIHNPSAAPDDDEILATAKRVRPEIIFYIGACAGFGLPSVSTFRALRKIAPSVNLCSDAADQPWWPVLDYYRKMECFDLQVSIDGARNEHVDHATVTPVDPAAFSGPSPVRDILCGFSGSADHGPRQKIVNALKMRALLTHRRRSADGTYADHVAFLRRCISTVNVSLTGTGRFHHIKGRAIEAGWAGACLLECEGSPAAEWFPPGSFISYSPRDSDKTARLLTEPQRLFDSAAVLAAHVRVRFTPKLIFGEILERLNVAAPLEKSAA